LGTWPPWEFCPVVGTIVFGPWLLSEFSLAVGMSKLGPAEAAEDAEIAEGAEVAEGAGVAEGAEAAEGAETLEVEGRSEEAATTVGGFRRRAGGC
jgi:hypothetical protein